jgi:hypothetical protein
MRSILRSEFSSPNLSGQFEGLELDDLDASQFLLKG